MKASLAALLLFGAFPLATAAQTTTPAEGMRLVRQMADAARQLNYSGTFVYRHGAQIETSRIWHLTDSSGDYERLETLDGPRREIVRTNEEVTCFYPAAKTAKMERWTPGRRFPAVVSEQLAAIVANYTVRKGPIDRVAGHDCQVAILEPRIIEWQTPEEQELEQKLTELKALETELIGRELEMVTLQTELSNFERRYLQVVGVRYAKLDEIEATIAKLLATQNDIPPV